MCVCVAVHNGNSTCMCETISLIAGNNNSIGIGTPHSRFLEIKYIIHPIKYYYMVHIYVLYASKVLGLSEKSNPDLLEGREDG